jgi:hypothetical protein
MDDDIIVRILPVLSEALFFFYLFTFVLYLARQGYYPFFLPDPLFLPPPEILFTVAQARAPAVFVLIPFFS